MDCNLLINGVHWGYNPLTNLLLTSWDILVPQTSPFHPHNSKEIPKQKLLVKGQGAHLPGVCGWGILKGPQDAINDHQIPIIGNT